MDECSKRRPETFVAEPNQAAPVVFGDGTAWYLPLPWLELRPKFEGGKCTRVYRAIAYGGGLDEILAGIAEAEDDTTAIVGAASVAAALLKRQYELEETELDQLLSFRPAEPQSIKWIGEVMEIATGRRGRRKAVDQNE
jgi:hypothetical protein